MQFLFARSNAARRSIASISFLLVLALAAMTLSFGRSPVAASATYTSNGISTSATVSSSVVRVGDQIAVDVTANAGTRFLSSILVEVHGPSGRVHSAVWTKEPMGGSRTRTFATTWAVPSNAPSGEYTVKVGVFRSGWSVLAHWNDQAATFSVGSPTSTTAPPGTTAPAATTAPATTAPATTVPPTTAPATSVTPTTVAPVSGSYSANGITSRAIAGGQVVVAGNAASITAEVTSTTNRTALVDVEVFDSSGQLVHQKWWDGQAMTAGATLALATTWTPPATATGTYVVKIGVFATGWTRLDHWNNGAATITVGTSSTPTTVAPATTVTPTTVTPTTVPPATTLPPATTVPTPSPTGRFTTVGHHIVDLQGNKFIPIGANVTSEPSPAPPTWSWWSTNQKYATGKSAEALAWGWNFVRVSVTTGGQPEVTLQQNFDGVFKLIDEYTAKGIVVTASLWDFMGKNPTWADVLANPHVLALQDQLVARYKNNPYVWLNPLNEPYTWEYGSNWAAVGTALYDRARAQGWTGVFVWELPSYGQYIEAAATTSMATDFLGGKQSTVLSWHNYGAGDDVRQDQWAEQVIAKGIPMMIGEFGQHWDPNNHSNPMDAGERRGTNWTLTRAYKYGFGAVAWHGAAATYNQFALRMGTGSAWYDYPGAPPLSEVGTRLRDLGLNRPAPIKII